jgi:transposase-like protein
VTQPSISLPEALRKGVEQAGPDLLRELLRIFVEKLMGEDADAAAVFAPNSETSDNPRTTLLPAA